MQLKPPLVIDYESYYDDEISASKQGVQNYVKASYGYIISLVSDNLRWCGTVEDAQKKFGGTNLFQIHQPWAANSNFDQEWHERYFPNWIPLSPWKCVLDEGATQQLPQHLAGMTKVLFGKAVDKTIRDEMKGVHWSDVPPSRQAEVISYCLNDGVQELAVIKKLPAPTDVEQEVAAHTRMLNRRGVAVDTDLIERNKTSLEEYRHRCFLAIPWHNDAKPLSPQALSAHCNKLGVPCPKSTAQDDEECEELMDAHPALNEVLGYMRGFRKSNTMLRKINSVIARVTEEGVMPLELIYCGARHTRRWSSRGVNVQNLNKLPLVTKGNMPAEDVLKAYDAGTLPEGVEFVYPRHWLIPRPGKKFLILDFSQIEPRALNWLVGNEQMLEAMRKGFGIYEAYARASMKWTGGNLKKENAKMYQLAKATVLGAGYGAGWRKFKEVAMTMCGLALTDAEAEAAIKGFRESNPRILKFWASFDQLVRQAVLDKDKKIEITMPTGDILRHFYVRPFARKQIGGKTITGYESYTTAGDFGHQSHQPNLWGGVLTENVVQRMARDLLAEGVIRCEKAGLPVIFTSHDEAIFEVDDDASKDDAQKTAIEILTKAPDWCPDLPLAVEGGFADRYAK